MDTTVRHPGTIVVGIDGSQMSERALDWAAEAARLEHRPLTLVHATGGVGALATVWPGSVAYDQVTVLEAMRTDGQQLLDTAAERVATRFPEVVVLAELRSSDARQALLDASRDASMVVVGSRGRGPVRSLLLGSVSVALSKHAECPVVVVRPHNPGTIRRGVLVGADGTAASLPTLEFAYRQASIRGLPLTVIHCFWDAVSATTGSRAVAGNEPRLEELRLVVAESVSGFAEKFPDVHVTVELARGLADDILGAASPGMDLIVVGRHHTNPLAAVVLGSVAPTVVEHAECVVAVVPAPDQDLRHRVGTSAPDLVPVPEENLRTRTT
jgi:nucleotide-binding universal stress UspA family protein